MVAVLRSVNWQSFGRCALFLELCDELPGQPAHVTALLPSIVFAQHVVKDVKVGQEVVR